MSGESDGRMIFCRRIRLQPVRACLIVAATALLLLPSLLAAQTEPKTASSKSIPVEVFQGPKPKKVDRSAMAYPTKELLQRVEGWVVVGFMVDKNGKPFEAAVLQSSGNKKFEQAALKLLQRTNYEPATLNGAPVESAMELPVRFFLEEARNGPSKEFARDFALLQSATGAHDRLAADAALNKLQVTSFVENAYMGLGLAAYAENWGTPEEELTGLWRAVGSDDERQYLPAAQFKSTLLACMSLELRLNRFPEAIRSWQRLKKLGVDAATLAKYEPIFAQVETLRSDEREYLISGQLSPTGSWSVGLFKGHFRAEAEGGSISEVKFRCEKRFFYIAFDPALVYDVRGAHGSCAMEVRGTPGARVKLFQS